MLMLEDDKEDSPWMVLGSLQLDATSAFHQSVHEYVRRKGLAWTVAAMLPIRYTWQGHTGKKQLAPDVCVAMVPERPRPSFDADSEGGFPPFVLEVVSPSSTERDLVEKRQAYELLDVREYALFTPHDDRPSELFGYVLGPDNEFTSWAADDRGWLWSEILGLYLLPLGVTIRAATADGKLLPTVTEAVDAAEREAEAREREAEARREFEAENERLRQEIERLRRET